MPFEVLFSSVTGALDSDVGAVSNKESTALVKAWLSPVAVVLASCGVLALSLAPGTTAAIPSEAAVSGAGAAASVAVGIVSGVEVVASGAVSGTGLAVASGVGIVSAGVDSGV